MNKTYRIASTLALAATMLTAPLAAQAQEPVRGKQAGDLVLGFSAIGVLPEKGGRVDAIGGKPDAGNSYVPQLDLTWFASPYMSLNLIAATTRHDLKVRGSAIGDVDLGHVWALPPTLTLQFHPLPASRFSPYVGLGVNYTLFYGEGGSRTAPVEKVDVKNSWGWALNVGMDYELNPRWSVNLDAKKLFLQPHAAVNSGAIGARADLDPWIFGVGLRYRF
ncbi:OmpW/AlkL family protein [Roseomonas marmotae]|uniref:Outer membrane beta-barrel protein n=1 Tax=Roseomonas marmotae TaxID=2768161 RepID=A0ABS3K8R3_9PROT|nr:OmpW family outer membrane protein [Roseomonas marmotae]MBO1073859.1 outer membrane beta-barrel protein [Roseomonas marmotae]QTI78514.1 outer membrane beta-barrel protein [Roseomonas marmotae]